MARRDRKPLKARARGLFRNQFTCACCPGKTFRGHRALNAHHLSRHGGYWAGQKARSAGRKIGKAQDELRKHARGWQESHGWLNHRGKATAKLRSRPDGPVRRIKDLRDRDRHGRDSDRTDQRADRYERRADRRDGRARRHDERATRLKNDGRTEKARKPEERAAAHRERAAAHRERVADERMAHHQRWPERTSR